jgi:hypothetical protein
MEDFWLIVTIKEWRWDGNPCTLVPNPNWQRALTIIFPSVRVPPQNNGLTPGRAVAGALLPRRVHVAGADRRHRLPEQGLIYGLLSKAAAEAMLTIAADPKHLGARIGITAVLHIWDSAMTHHPHPCIASGTAGCWPMPRTAPPISLVHANCSPYHKA